MRRLCLFALIAAMSLSLSCFQVVVPNQSGPNSLPIAYIDSIQPASVLQGAPVAFTGHGSDIDGTVIGYEWRSSRDGIIGTAPSFATSSLSAGAHSISLRVLDNTNQWSPAVNSAVTVAAKAAGPVIEQFTVEPGSVIYGNPVELHWKVMGADSVIIDNGVGRVSATGYLQLYPIATQSFTLTAVNNVGTTTKVVLVTVQHSTIAGDPIISFTAEHIGGVTWRLHWTVTNATQVVIDPDIGVVNPRGTRDVIVPSGMSRTYKLTAKNNWGWAYWQVFLISP